LFVTGIIEFLPGTPLSWLYELAPPNYVIGKLEVSVKKCKLIRIISQNPESLSRQSLHQILISIKMLGGRRKMGQA
jgi:hypothetical protein